MKVLSNIVKSFIEQTEGEFTDLNGYKMSANSNVSRFYLNPNTSLLYDKQAEVLLIENKKIPKRHKKVYSDIVKQFPIVFNRFSHYSNEYYERLNSIIEVSIDDLKKLAEKIEEIESDNRDELKDAIKNKLYTALDYSKKITNYYNKIAYPIATSLVTSVGISRSYEFSDLFYFIINEDIIQEKQRVGDKIIEVGEESDEISEIMKEHADKIIELSNNDIRLRQLKAVFKITDDKIKSYLTDED